MKLLYFVGFLSVIVLIIGFFVFINKPEATCVDKKQNQGEDGVDCGGPCAPCLGEVKDLIVHWVKPFKVSEGKYDVVALVENPSLKAGIESLDYQIKIYDTNNILITSRIGSSFVNPEEQFIAFESNIEVGTRIPSRAFIEFSKNQNWKYVKRENLTLSMSNKDFINEPFPKLTVSLRNNSFFDLKDVYAGAVIFNKEGNAIGASITKVDQVKSDSSRQIFFTWPEPFLDEYVSSKIFLRTNQTKNN